MANVVRLLKVKIKTKQNQSLICIEPVNQKPANQKQTLGLGLEVELNTNWFDVNYWKNKGCISGQAEGRFITWFIQPTNESQEWVLRHYYRGGMIAKLSRDRFFYTGLKNTRNYREIKLLQNMIELGLPVPKPIGGRVIKKGLFYQADLLMEKLDAVDLCAILQERCLTIKEWKKVGELIAMFHHHGVYHSDLNAHNIMLDTDEQFWLIDFDRCEIRKNEINWQQHNLARLKRSFLKEKTRNTVFNFDEHGWSELVVGYKKGIDDLN